MSIDLYYCEECDTPHQAGQGQCPYEYIHKEHDPYECEYEHCRACRQHWMDEKDDLSTRKEK